ncbi:MAG: signal peptide peptidase SppA [candidate division Zixibacteria bacterium]
MGKNRDKIILGVIALMLVGGFLFTFAFIYMLGKSTNDIGFGSLSGRLAQVDIKGVIIDSEDIVRQVKKYQEDSSVKGLVLRVDSPGGGVAASQEIYDQLMKFKDDGKIIIVSMGAVAASGGYYVACAADSIVANPGTITGSIGVILSYPVAEQLMDKVGMKMEVIKSGRLKDVGNYAREATPEDRKMLQALIDDTYEQFVDVVAVSRGMEIDLVKRYADGSVFTGRQANEFGLIDKLGTLEDAIVMAGELADLGDDPGVIKERKLKRPFWAAIENLLGVNLSMIIRTGRTWPVLEYIYGY